MNKVTTNTIEKQDQRLKIKTINQRMQNLVVQGTGMSPWEAEVIVGVIDEVYFSDPELKHAKTGQIKYQCISAREGAGKALKNCQMVTVLLTLLDEEDDKDLSIDSNKDRSIEIRQRRLVRITDEAKEQEGYLSQEDLAQLLMCDVRTIRRDTRILKKRGIILPTRGQQKDIGPGVSHRAIAVRLWLEGKEPVAIAQHIKHSIAAVENYLQKFQRITYLKRKGFNAFEIAMTIGISVSSANTFISLYEEFKSTTFFEQRLQEIDHTGSYYYQAQDEKKSSLSTTSTSKKWRKP